MAARRRIVARVGTGERVRTEVAALYVEKGGAYYDLPGVDPWDEERDARLYAGPYPVVAHPPCARWCQLAPMMESMYDYRVGDDGGCFEAALDAVRRFGGVLEHPAGSIAWSRFSLPRPVRHGWTRALFGDVGWSTQVDQSAYGHAARKRTWLYYVGDEPPPLDWREPRAARRISSFGHGRKIPEAERVRPREASATPAAFREVLLSMARSAVPSFDILPEAVPTL
jgi:hypothetical protein